MSSYKKITGVLYQGRLHTDPVVATNLIKAGRRLKLISMSGADVIFYCAPNGDIIMPSDVITKYLIDGLPATPKDLVEVARGFGFSGSDTAMAASVIRKHGRTVQTNPSPKNKLEP